MSRDDELMWGDCDDLIALAVLLVGGGLWSADRAVKEWFSTATGRRAHVLMPARLTPATWTEMSGAFAGAWRNGFGTMPTREQLAMALAHSALETGSWQHMYCNNAGNLTTSQRGYYMLPGNARHFAVYPNLETGAGAHVSLLSRRYPVAFAAMRAGDVAAYVTGLYHGDRGQAYCPDCDPIALTRSLQALYDKFRAKFAERNT